MTARTDEARQRLLGAIASQIDAVRCGHPVRVAVDGVDASGKTTFADEVSVACEALGRTVIRASIDGFHNPAAVRRQRGSTSPEGYFHDSFNYPALIESVLQPLGPGGSRCYRRAVFDFRTDREVATSTEQAPEDAVLILDGVFLLRPELREHFDFSIFLHADFDVTLKRAETRDLALFGSVDEIHRRYRERYIPGQQLYLASVHPESLASVVIDNNDYSSPMLRTS